MAEKRNIEYDSDAVFISYSPEDIDWAEDELRPRLEKSGVKVITGEDLTGGATVSLNRERAIADTRRTIVVLSPEWVANSWNGFEADMLIHLDPAAIKRKLLPVLLRKTEVPPRIARLTIRDLTGKKRYDSRLAQLIRDVEDSVPPPPPEAFPNRWEWYWRQARRRGATPGRIVAALLFTLVVYALFFIRVPGWQRLPVPLLDNDLFVRLYRVDNLLLVASATETETVSGLWRSQDGSKSWQAVGGFLDLGGVRAAVRDFAHSDSAIYAATRGSGLWKAGKEALAWEQVGSKQLPPKLHRVAVSADGKLLVVSALDEGVYLSTDSGSTWRRADGAAGCQTDPAHTLPAPLRQAALLIHQNRVYVGSGGDVPVNSGLFASQDDGRCWERVHGRSEAGPETLGVEYLALAGVDGTDEVLVLFDDKDRQIGENPYRLVALYSREPQWKSSQGAIPRLLVAPESAGGFWAVATDFARVDTGTLSATSARGTLPPLLSCVLLCTVQDMAFDVDGQGLILLTADRLYRQGIVPGYRFLWP